MGLLMRDDGWRIPGGNVNDDHDPIDAVETAHMLAGTASTIRTFYVALLNEGFSEADALRLSGAFLHGIAGGKLS